MKKEQIEEMLEKMGIEYRYHHFEESEAVNPPFICWLIPGSDNFAADGKTFFKVDKLDIELYTDSKDTELEQKVEQVLEDYGIYWEKTETYIESENMYEVLYEMEV
ncbi:MAG: hypothetical protein GX284_00705 [Clostridiales bacterium]|nr:hypothetical protein [Clostridiales bacterium]